MLCLSLVCIYTVEGEASGPGGFFLSTQMRAVCGSVQPGNEKGFVDWPDEEKLDSS